MDPAVVAVSSFAPPSRCAPSENINVFNNVGNDPNMIGAMGDLNLNHVTAMNNSIKTDDQIDEWDSNENTPNSGVSDFDDGTSDFFKLYCTELFLEGCYFNGDDGELRLLANFHAFSTNIT